MGSSYFVRIKFILKGTFKFTGLKHFLVLLCITSCATIACCLNKDKPVFVHLSPLHLVFKHLQKATLLVYSVRRSACKF